MKIDKIAKILMVSATAAVASYVPASHAATTEEVEINDTLPKAQGLGNNSSHSVAAVMGAFGQQTHNDVDFYTFEANEGDVITVDIDNGYGGAGSVNTILAIFDASGKKWRENDNADYVDEGSISTADAMIEAFTVPATGTYMVGVSSYPRFFNNDGSVMSNPKAKITPSGDYTLNISGITMRVKQINFEVKPGSEELTPLNPRSKGKIPVAILGAADFDVSTINQASLTFGSSGNENSLASCQPVSRDINKDGYGDLLCHFNNAAAGFRSGDIEVKMKGQTMAKQAFEGQSLLKVVPSVRQ